MRYRLATFNKMLSQNTQEERLFFWGALILFIAFCSWSMLSVNMNNDEANHHFLLACQSSPLLKLDPTRLDRCEGIHDLKTPLGLTIPRANPYVGVLPTVLYAPFFYAFHSPYVQYAFGLFFFFVFIALLSRLTPIPHLTIPILLTFLPLSFSFIHDLGPIKYAMIIFPLSALILQKINSATPHARCALSALLAIAIFLAIEEKPFFFYLMPSLCCFMLAFAGNNWSSTIKSLIQSRYALILSACLLMALSGLLLFSKIFTGDYYITFIIMMMEGKELKLPILDEGFTWGERLFRFIFFWPQYFHRFLNVDLMDISGNARLSFREFLFLCSPPTILFALCVAAMTTIHKAGDLLKVSSRTLFLILSFIILLVTFRFFGKVWAAHHFIFLWLPLIVLFIDLIARVSPQWKRALILAFCLTNATTWAWVSTADHLDETLDERKVISAYFDEETSGKAVINYPSWGYNLIHSLYGPSNQIVVRVPLDRKLTNNLFDLAQTMGRDVYYVCGSDNNHFGLIVYGSCDKDVYEADLTTITGKPTKLVNMTPGLKVWRVYKVVQSEY